MSFTCCKEFLRRFPPYCLPNLEGLFASGTLVSSAHASARRCFRSAANSVPQTRCRRRVGLTHDVGLRLATKVFGNV